MTFQRTHPEHGVSSVESNVSSAPAKLHVSNAPSVLSTPVNMRTHLAAYISVVAVVGFELHLPLDNQCVIDSVRQKPFLSGRSRVTVRPVWPSPADGQRRCSRSVPCPAGHGLRSVPERALSPPSAHRGSSRPVRTRGHHAGVVQEAVRRCPVAAFAPPGEGEGRCGARGCRSPIQPPNAGGASR